MSYVEHYKLRYDYYGFKKSKIYELYNNIKKIKYIKKKITY